MARLSAACFLPNIPEDPRMRQALFSMLTVKQRTLIATVGSQGQARLLLVSLQVAGGGSEELKEDQEPRIKELGSVKTLLRGGYSSMGKSNSESVEFAKELLARFPGPARFNDCRRERGVLAYSLGDPRVPLEVTPLVPGVQATIEGATLHMVSMAEKIRKGRFISYYDIMVLSSDHQTHSSTLTYNSGNSLGWGRNSHDQGIDNQWNLQQVMLTWHAQRSFLVGVNVYSTGELADFERTSLLLAPLNDSTNMTLVVSSPPVDKSRAAIIARITCTGVSASPSWQVEHVTESVDAVGDRKSKFSPELLRQARQMFAAGDGGGQRRF